MTKKDYSGWCRFEIEEALKHHLFDLAEPPDTKETIMQRLKEEMEDIDSRGPRFPPLLFFTIANYGLHKMQTHPRVLDKTFIVVIEDFKKEWDRNPEIRRAYTLAEYL